METRYKKCAVVDTKVDAEAGTFEATVGVFGNVDIGGDRILPQAFDRTLDNWRKSGDPIPVILSHDWDNPFSHIGIVDPKDAKVVEKGLRVKGKLDVKTNEVAAQVHLLMARRSMKEFSFGYKIFPGGEQLVQEGRRLINELSDIDLLEIGPTLKGMNPETELHAVKSALGIKPPTDEELRTRAAAAEREEQEREIPEVPPAPEPIKCSEGHITTTPQPGQTLLPCGCVLETATAEAKAEAGITEHEPAPEPPEAELQRTEAQRVAREQQRADEEARVPEVPEAPPVSVTPNEAREELNLPPVPPTEAQKAEAERIESEAREREAATRRAAEEARIPDVPPAPPAPPAATDEPPPVVPPTEAQKAEADRIAREAQKEADTQRRAAEEASLPAVPPAPPPKATPPPRPVPNAERLKAEAARVEAEQGDDAARAARAAEEARIPAVPPAPAKALASNTSERLGAAGQERFGSAGTPGQETYVYVDDWDPDKGIVIYCISSSDERKFVQVAYTAGADGTITLADTETEVVRVVGYQTAGKASAPDADGQRAKAAQVVRDEEIRWIAGSEPPARKALAAIYPGTTGPQAYARLNALELGDGTFLTVSTVDAVELAGIKDGTVKATWSTAYVNALPDSAFLYVAPGGEKDEEGKTTPRSLRYFPYKDAAGNIDLPHLRNALARIPQSSLSDTVKEGLTARAQRILDAQKAETQPPHEQDGSRKRDPLRERADAVALEFASAGESQRRTRKEPSPRTRPELMPVDQLRERMHDEMLASLSGGISES